MKFRYINLDKFNTTSTIPQIKERLHIEEDVNFKVVSSSVVNFYSLVNAMKSTNPHDFTIILHTYSDYQNNHKMLAYATTYGVNVYYAVDSVNEILFFEGNAKLPKKPYGKLSNTQKGYNVINRILEQIEAESYEAYSESCRLERLEGAIPKDFHLTPEKEWFIRTYAPAYGIRVPKFEDTESTCTSFNKEYTRGFRDIQENRNPQKSLRKWDIKMKDSMRADTIVEIYNVYAQLKFYITHNIPMDDNYRICPKCGKPFRANPYGYSDYDEPNQLCMDCEEDLSIEEDLGRSFNEAFTKRTFGRRRIVTKNID